MWGLAVGKYLPRLFLGTTSSPLELLLCNILNINSTTPNRAWYFITLSRSASPRPLSSHMHATNAAAPEAPTTKEGSQSRPKRRGGVRGLKKLCGVSPELQTVVCHPALPRTEAVKKLYAGIVHTGPSSSYSHDWDPNRSTMGYL